MSAKTRREKMSALRLRIERLLALNRDLAAELLVLAEERDEARAWAGRLYRENRFLRELASIYMPRDWDYAGIEELD
jgi:hypothetical protein